MNTSHNHLTNPPLRGRMELWYGVWTGVWCGSYWLGMEIFYIHRQMALTALRLAFFFLNPSPLSSSFPPSTTGSLNGCCFSNVLSVTSASRRVLCYLTTLTRRRLVVYTATSACVHAVFTVSTMELQTGFISISMTVAELHTIVQN